MSRPDQTGQEEQYVLRVTDVVLAARLRSLLREEIPLEQQIKLIFTDNGRQGTLTIDNETYPVHVLDLPSTVECYKTYDDVNLVKSGDVGQMLLVGQPNPQQMKEIIRAKTQMAAQQQQQQQASQGNNNPSPTFVLPMESLDGVTPPMRSARERHLRPRPEVPPEVMAKVEEAVIDILDGYAPASMEFEDIEEQYVIDSKGLGRWQRITKEEARKTAKEAALKEEAAQLQAEDGMLL